MVNVNSTILNPPSMQACMALGQASEVGVRRTAQARILANLVRTALKLSVDLARSSDDEVERKAREATAAVLLALVRRRVFSLVVLRRSAMVVLLLLLSCSQSL